MISYFPIMTIFNNVICFFIFHFLFLAVLGLCCCEELFFYFVSRGCSLLVVCINLIEVVFLLPKPGLGRVGFNCRRNRLRWTPGLSEHWLNNCGTQSSLPSGMGSSRIRDRTRHDSYIVRWFLYC